MRMLRLLPLIAMHAVVLCPCLAEESNGLKTVAEIRELRNLSFNAERSLSLTGVVTLVDPERNLFVIQDETGAVALHPDVPGVAVEPGQRISLQAAGCVPYVANRPDFPFTPTGREIRSSFEIPENEGEYRLTRMRGWLMPPVTGEYTFWIASDDSSELWLGEESKPESVRRVALVPPGQWTAPREWSRFLSQRSERIFLRAGESYYIEALQEQAQAASHLAVAWEGPEQKLAIIDGAHLVPWNPDGKAEGGGILREYWNDYAVARVDPLTSASADKGELSVRGLKVAVLDQRAWPEPRNVDPANVLQPDDAWRWVEASGEVRFIASEGGTATLELTSGESRYSLRVARWQGSLPTPNSRWNVKFRGVCEAGRDMNGRFVLGSVWTPSEREVTLSQAEGLPPPPPADSALANPTPAAALGGGYFTRGVVTFSGEVLGKPCLVVQEALGGIFVSQEERQPHPLLRPGHFVEIGGNLVPRKFAPGIRPLSLNILGTLNLPAPATPAAEVDHRDGLWTEMEGVVRRVNADGTLLLMGQHEPIRVWLGQSERSRLDELVDSTLCVRGVMSLETFGSPLLLVPSRSFVEIKEQAPEIPAQPTPIARLKEALSEGGPDHRVKIEGMVTYCNDHFFFVQDDSGAVRVLADATLGREAGAAVSVTGFPDREGLGIRMSETASQPIAARSSVVPVRLDPEQVQQSPQGELVALEARLLSRVHRDGAWVFELQAGRQMVEAILDAPGTSLPEFKAGSLLKVTGVLDSASSSPNASRQILMRSTQDVVLVEGPPWWTWQRAVVFIGVLLVVLAGSLLRIRFLHRRFERQQAARLAFTRAMLESQESERRRIAASLHDSLGQELLVIRNQAHLALQSAPDALRPRLEEISETTLQAINEVREITRNLRPYQLDRLGLTQSIRALTRKVSENCSIEFACHVDEVDGLFDSESEIHLYRIVQEGINNVLKHSGATEAAVVVKKIGGDLSISIRDNGRGLPQGVPSSTAGFGLSGIKERAEIMGGTARMDSTSGQGVNLQILLPLPSKCETASKS